MKPEPIELYAAIQPFVEQEARRVANDVYDTKGTQYGVGKIPYHEHNGIDSPNVPYKNLDSIVSFLYWTIPGTSAATASNYSMFWTCPATATVVGMTEVHTTAGTAGGAVTLQLEKLTDTQAPDAGVVLLMTALDLKGVAANTVQTAAITQKSTITGIRDCTLAVNDRLCLKDSGTLTSVANVTVVVQIQFA